MSEFHGFSPETFDFLWGLRFHNNREWFMEHKSDYLSTLYEPMKALGAALYEPFKDVTGLGYRVSRIYKDVRFSKGDPYKDHLWISLRRETQDWSSVPTLFFQVTPEEYSYGLVYWRPLPKVMETFRRELAERPEVLALIEQAEQASGCTLGGEEYVRKKPAPRAELERFYSLRGFVASVNRAPDALLFSQELVPTVQKTLLALLPLNEYFQRLTTTVSEA